MAVDPVCHMNVDEKSAAATSEYGQDVLFLLPRVQDEIRSEPAAVREVASSARRRARRSDPVP